MTTSPAIRTITPTPTTEQQPEAETPDRFPSRTPHGLVWEPGKYVTPEILARARMATDAARSAAEAIWTMCQITKELAELADYLLRPHSFVDDWKAYAEELATVEMDLDLSTLFYMNATFVTWLENARGGHPGPAQAYARNLAEFLALDEGWEGTAHGKG